VAEIGALEKAYAERIPRASAEERPWWQLAQTVVFVALETALRRGELLALRWRDISFLDGTLRVREAWVGGKFVSPKSRTSRRTIELGPATLARLEERWQASGYRGDEELVFGHPEKGTPLDPSKLSRLFLRPALKAAGISKPFRPWHDLRHTALTHEAAAGNPQAYVQMKAGHSQGSITERYIHAAQVLFPGAAARAEERMFSGLAARSTSRP
jgi:integrase